MKYIFTIIITTVLSIFFLVGAFLVNFPAGNYGWAVYDVVMAIVVWFVCFTILQD